MFIKPRHVNDYDWHVVRPKKIAPKYRLNKINNISGFLDHCDRYKLNNHDRVFLLSQYLGVSEGKARYIIRRICHSKSI